MKTHEGHPSFTKALFRGRAVGIYAHRDIRDVLFSLMYKRRQNFREIVRTGMIHQILVNDRFWRLHPQVLVQRYDEIMQRPEKAVHEIADFLRVTLPEGEAARIAAAHTKEANLQRTRATQAILAEKGLDLATDDNAEVYDPKTLLHWNHIRPKALGWRELATIGERSVMRRLLGAWLSENEYPPDLMNDVPEPVGAGKAWRVDTVHGLFRCHSRELSSKYHRWAQPLKRLLGLGQGESRSKSVDSP